MPVEAQTSKINPLVAIAAVSVIIFSAVGVGVMTGVIPSSKSEQAAAPTPTTAAAPAPAATPAAAPASEAAPAEAPRKVAKTQHEPKHEAKHEPTHVASAEPPRVAQNQPAPPPPAPKICGNCGSVVAINTSKQKGEGSGLGAVGGAVVGGLLGNQVGRGTGRTVATVVGAGAGALAGNEVEKRAKSTETYHVAVRMDDGSTREFTYNEAPSFRAGDKVKVVDGGLVLQ